jgi:hypothetical protein
LGLQAKCYDRLVKTFHSSAIKVDLLAALWAGVVLKLASTLLYRSNGRIVVVGDGIKVSKEGKKMPAVKLLHQESQSNSKPPYIMGHFCQALSLLGACGAYFFALPIVCRIHEGVVFSNRDQRSLLDKMMLMLESLNLSAPYYFVADGLLRQRRHREYVARGWATSDHPGSI